MGLYMESQTEYKPRGAFIWGGLILGKTRYYNRILLIKKENLSSKELYQTKEVALKSVAYSLSYTHSNSVTKKRLSG